MNVLNLPPTFTIATAQWTHTGFYPPELGITFNYDQERGESSGRVKDYRDTMKNLWGGLQGILCFGTA